MKNKTSLILTEVIAQKIHVVRGSKVMLDSDLAMLYGVPTKRLNEQVRRNLKRFPGDFMIKLTEKETHALRSQFATLEKKPSSKGSHRKYLPLAFTEQGVAMLSSVLNSNRAIRVNIVIIRAFVQLRQLLATNQELVQKLKELESKYDGRFRVVFEALRTLVGPPQTKTKPVGFGAYTR